MTVTLTATFTALPGHRAEVAALIADFAATVRREPGNMLFVPLTSSESGHEFTVFEQYADDAAFASHLRNPAGVPFNAALAGHIVGDGSQLSFFDIVTR